MSTPRIACTHPGKLGDALYAIPSIRELSRIHECKIDFYTSSYCEPLRRLFEAQDCIEHFVISDQYVLQDFDCGGQPWSVPVSGEYDVVFQMGFQGFPHQALPDHIAVSAGLPTGLPLWYDFDLPPPDIDEPYIVSAPRPSMPLFREIADTSAVRAVEIGGVGEASGSTRALDKTGLDMLDTLPWIAHARGFVGYHSSMLVLANGFPIPKITWTPSGADWLLAHAVKSRFNHYPIEPTAAEILQHLGVLMTFCKTIELSDYQAIHEMQHARNINAIVGSFQHEHRAWEYGMVLRALRDNGAKRILDVGGGGSAFAPAAAWPDVGMDVTVVDPQDYGVVVQQQSQKIGRPIHYVQQDFMAYDGQKDFDGVSCISVLEHVHDDTAFFTKLASHVRPGGILALTVDFWPDGAQKSGDHLRTYTEQRLRELVDSVPSFETLGNLSYGHPGQHVYSYTFASLILKRLA